MPLTHKLSRSTIYILVIIYMSMAAMTIGSIVYANHATAQTARQWCQVVVTLDDVYKKTPPTTPAGKELAREIHILRVEKLRC